MMARLVEHEPGPESIEFEVVTQMMAIVLEYRSATEIEAHREWEEQACTGGHA